MVVEEYIKSVERMDGWRKVRDFQWDFDSASYLLLNLMPN